MHAALVLSVLRMLDAQSVYALSRLEDPAYRTLDGSADRWSSLSDLKSKAACIDSSPRLGATVAVEVNERMSSSPAACLNMDWLPTQKPWPSRADALGFG